MEPLTQQRVFDDIKKQGLDEVKKSVSKMSQTIAPFYDKYIKDYEELCASERREEREEENLSISRKALASSRSANKSSRCANIIAIIAITIATAAFVLSAITYIWPPKINNIKSKLQPQMQVYVQ